RVRLALPGKAAYPPQRVRHARRGPLIQRLPQLRQRTPAEADRRRHLPTPTGLDRGPPRPPPHPPPAPPRHAPRPLRPEPLVPPRVRRQRHDPPRTPPIPAHVVPLESGPVHRPAVHVVPADALQHLPPVTRALP